MLDETGCDAVMIGRAVLGNPWIIKNCIDYLETGSYKSDISLNDKIEMLQKHLELLNETKNEKIALLEIRSHAIWYLKGVTGGAKVKNDICSAKSVSEILRILNEFKEEYNGK